MDNDLNVSVVDASANSTVLSTVDSILLSVHVTTALSAQALPITDGAGGSALVSLPASAAVGSIYEWSTGVPFRSGIVVDPNDAATGALVVVWRASKG